MILEIKHLRGPAKSFGEILVRFIAEMGIIIEPYGRGPKSYHMGRSPCPGLPSCGLRPHSGRPGRGERPFGVTEGTLCRVVLFLLYLPLKYNNSDLRGRTRYRKV